MENYNNNNKINGICKGCAKPARVISKIAAYEFKYCDNPKCRKSIIQNLIKQRNCEICGNKAVKIINHGGFASFICGRKKCVIETTAAEIVECVNCGKKNKTMIIDEYSNIFCLKKCVIEGKEIK